MKDLIIIGAGGWGREVYNTAKACIDAGSDFYVKGFLDDNDDALDGYEGYPTIISSIQNYIPQENDVFVCALGSPHTKKKCTDLIKRRGGKFITLIHPSAHIGDNAEIGEGCIISLNTCIGQDVKMGAFVTLDGVVGVGHDCVIGDYCHISPQCSIGGFTIIEKNVTIHPGVHIVIRTKIGENAVIGIGSIVIKKVKPGCVVFGNPAKVIDQVKNF